MPASTGSAWSPRTSPSTERRQQLRFWYLRTATTGHRVADREGLAALSMRKVAAELDVGTMSLYRYIPGKGELLDLMLDHVNGPAPAPQEHRDTDWRRLMELVARGIWQLYLDHPWLLQVNQTRPILGPNAIAGFDYALDGLDGLGLPGREKVAVILAVDHQGVLGRPGSDPDPGHGRGQLPGDRPAAPRTHSPSTATKPSNSVSRNYSTAWKPSSRTEPGERSSPVHGRSPPVAPVIGNALRRAGGRRNSRWCGCRNGPPIFFCRLRPARPHPLCQDHC